MLWFLLAIAYMNIGIAWVLHRGDADWSKIAEKITVQIIAILWPLSIIITYGYIIYIWNKRRVYNLKTNKSNVLNT
jgi:uncharacterized iron-regulated membrane protein